MGLMKIPRKGITTIAKTVDTPRAKIAAPVIDGFKKDAVIIIAPPNAICDFFTFMPNPRLSESLQTIVKTVKNVKVEL